MSNIQITTCSFCNLQEIQEPSLSLPPERPSLLWGPPCKHVSITSKNLFAHIKRNTKWSTRISFGLDQLEVSVTVPPVPLSARSPTSKWSPSTSIKWKSLGCRFALAWIKDMDPTANTCLFHHYAESSISPSVACGIFIKPLKNPSVKTWVHPQRLLSLQPSCTIRHRPLIMKAEIHLLLSCWRRYQSFLPTVYPIHKLTQTPFVILCVFS